MIRAPLLRLFLALALLAHRLLPQARVTVFDARAADRDVSGDPRTLALALAQTEADAQRLRQAGVIR